MKILIASLASGWYEHFAPMFVYAGAKYNPGCDVKVFIKRDFFPRHPDSACGLLRYCLPNECFSGYDYVFITDIDIIFLPIKPTTVGYYWKNMEKSGLSYAGVRGSPKSRKRSFDGKNSRISGAGLLVNREWLEKTWPFRERYIRKTINGMAFREKDEIYLQRMTRKAGFPIPMVPGKFTNGQSFDCAYRNLHLGDFKFLRRWNNIKKMRSWFLPDSNIPLCRKLLKDKKFLLLEKRASTKSGLIKELFDNLKYHLLSR